MTSTGQTRPDRASGLAAASPSGWTGAARACDAATPDARATFRFARTGAEGWKLDPFRSRSTFGGKADELLGEGVERGEATTLYEDSGGNPFYLEHSPEHSSVWAASSLRPRSARGCRGPADGRRGPAEELARLSEGAAVSPREPRLPAIRSIRAGHGRGGVDEPAVLEGIDELLRLDVIRQTDVPRRFRFRHPLVRRAVYDSTPGGWRLGAHERTAEALESEVPRRPPVRTMSSAPLARATPQRSRSCARPARTLRTERRQARLRLGSCWRRAPAPGRCAGRAAGRAPAGSSRYLAADRPVCLESRCTLVVKLRGRIPRGSIRLRVQLTAACAGAGTSLGRQEEACARSKHALDALERSELL